MKKLILPVAGIAVVAILYVASLETVIPFPSDNDHVTIKDEAKCLDCHGKGKEFARQDKHPPKDRCFKCHTAAADS